MLQYNILYECSIRIFYIFTGNMPISRMIDRASECRHDACINTRTAYGRDESA